MEDVKNSDKPDYAGHRERLKERLISGGGKSMPDYELLELVLTLAIPRRDVKPIAKELIKKFGTFAGVINASKEDLYTCKWVKDGAYAIFKIIQESVLRTSWQHLKNCDDAVVNNYDSLVSYCRSAMAYNDVEEFRIIFLNAKFKIVAEEIQQRGTIDCVAIHPREVIKAAISKAAASIIMVHNHPSGDVTPSKADIDITRRIKEAAQAVNITLWDHIIVSKSDEYSFRDKGILQLY